MNIYVGNLPFDTTQDQLEDLFAPFGQVESARVINDRITGQPRGFGFVQMAKKEEGEKAIAELNNTTFNNKQLRVNEARPREEGGAPRRSNGGGGMGGGNGSYNKRRY